MLQLFRKFFKSKVGIVVTLAFLGLIAFAFASMDVANTGTFGGVAGGDRVAVVGDRRIDTSELAQNASNAVDRLRQDNPTLTMEAFIAGGGLRDVLQQMITRAAIAEMARDYGLRAGDRLVDSEIVQMPEFRGFDGSFDADAFRTALRQRGLSEELVRSDLAMGLLARQLVTPVAAAPQVPQSIARRYAQLLQETRSGSIAAILGAAYAPEDDPSAAQLQAFHEENREEYIRPERRVIRYAAFGEEALSSLAQPTDAQIRQRYEENREQYAATETRSFTQLVAPTQAAAQAIVDQVQGGTSLEAAARAAGLATAEIPATTQAALARQTSPAVARAAFQASEGTFAEPARGDLGWYVLRVDSVERRAGRSLAEAREEIAAELAAEQRRRALNEATARIEEEFAEGRSLSEVAEELGIELQTTRPITAAGQVYGTQESAPEELERVLPIAFEMEESEPQLAETVPGETFLVFEVADVTPSATAPLNEIREQVVTDWRVQQGMEAAGQAARRVMQRVQEGATLAEAVAAEDVDLPTPDQVTLKRQQVAQQGQMPPALALFFSMAEGTVKRLESPQTFSWFVVGVDEITTPDIEADNPVVAATQQQLRSIVSEEYVAQFIAAVEDEIEIEINDAAVEAVAAQLTGQLN